MSYMTVVIQGHTKKEAQAVGVAESNILSTFTDNSNVISEVRHVDSYSYVIKNTGANEMQYKRQGCYEIDPAEAGANLWTDLSSFVALASGAEVVVVGTEPMLGYRLVVKRTTLDTTCDAYMISKFRT